MEELYQAIEEELPELEEEVVFRWRFDQLERAGYPGDAALDLAGRSDVDLHVALDLVKRGCPADLAFRILD
jgi:hypothetical protein